MCVYRSNTDRRRMVQFDEEVKYLQGKRKWNFES